MTKAFLALMLALLAAVVSFVWGYTQATIDLLDRNQECLELSSAFPMSEVCEFYGHESKCRLKSRHAYTYASHKYVACLYSKKGKAWGTGK